MAKIEDYLPGGKHDPAAADGINEEIQDAQGQQNARETSTQTVDWEERYKNLERLNSQQAQTLGDYRKIIDDFITHPTPAAQQPTQEESRPINYDDLYEKPQEVIQGAIDDALRNHPTIREAEELKRRAEQHERETAIADFRTRHPDCEEIAESVEFKSWVHESPSRLALAQAADQFDMNSADALFSLYKAEKGFTQVRTEQEESEAIQAASLEESSQQMVVDQPKYSRQDFIATKTRAEQGDLEAEQWIQRNVAAYREALASGNVRD